MKILIVHPGGGISDNPSLRSIINSFRNKSYKVTLWRRGSWSHDDYLPDIRYIEKITGLGGLSKLFYQSYL